MLTCCISFTVFCHLPGHEMKNEIRERERETDRQTDRQTDRDRETERQTERDRDRDRQRLRQRGRRRGRQRDRERHRETHRERQRQSQRHRDRDTETETDRQRQTDRDRQRQRQTGTQRQTHRETQRETETERDRERERDKQRERDRQTDRQTQTETETDRDGETETETQRDRDTDRHRQTDRQRQIDTQREHNKVQACLNWFENFYSKFSPILGLFQGLPGRLDETTSYETQFDYIYETMNSGPDQRCRTFHALRLILAVARGLLAISIITTMTVSCDSLASTQRPTGQKLATDIRSQCMTGFTYMAVLWPIKNVTYSICQRKSGEGHEGFGFIIHGVIGGPQRGVYYTD